MRRTETIYFALLLITFFLSAFFSGTETALISTSRIKLEILVRRNVHSARQALAFIEDPEQFLATTLVGNNIAMVAASSLLALYLKPYLNGFLITAVSSLALLFFGEILPKSIARDKAMTYTIRATYLLRPFSTLFYPLIWSVMRISQFLLYVFGLRQNSVKQFFTRKDLELLTREGEKVGLVAPEERSLISRMILRGNQKVREVMIPRTDITAVKLKKSVNEVVKLFERTGHSRLPVIGKSMDHVVGIVTARDIMLEKPAALKDILRDVYFVPDTARIAQLFTSMQDRGNGLAIAVDEYGGTAGLITMEDIVEEFFGDIYDEFDEEDSLYRKITPQQIDVKAQIHVSELNERFHLQLPEGEYHTLGGFLMDQLGHIPKRGERLLWTTCKLIVLSAYRKKVNWVRIIRKE